MGVRSSLGLLLVAALLVSSQVVDLSAYDHVNDEQLERDLTSGAVAENQFVNADSFVDQNTRVSIDSMLGDLANTEKLQAQSDPTDTTVEKATNLMEKEKSRMYRLAEIINTPDASFPCATDPKPCAEVDADLEYNPQADSAEDKKDKDAIRPIALLNKAKAELERKVRAYREHANKVMVRVHYKRLKRKSQESFGGLLEQAKAAKAEAVAAIREYLDQKAKLVNRRNMDAYYVKRAQEYIAQGQSSQAENERTAESRNKEAINRLQNVVNDFKQAARAKKQASDQAKQQLQKVADYQERLRTVFKAHLQRTQEGLEKANQQADERTRQVTNKLIASVQSRKAERKQKLQAEREKEKAERDKAYAQRVLYHKGLSKAATDDAAATKAEAAADAAAAAAKQASSKVPAWKVAKARKVLLAAAIQKSRAELKNWEIDYAKEAEAKAIKARIFNEKQNSDEKKRLLIVQNAKSNADRLYARLERLAVALQQAALRANRTASTAARQAVQDNSFAQRRKEAADLFASKSKELEDLQTELQNLQKNINDPILFGGATAKDTQRLVAEARARVNQLQAEIRSKQREVTDAKSEVDAATLRTQNSRDGMSKIQSQLDTEKKAQQDAQEAFDAMQEQYNSAKDLLEKADAAYKRSKALADTAIKQEEGEKKVDQAQEKDRRERNAKILENRQKIWAEQILDASQTSKYDPMDLMASGLADVNEADALNAATGGSKADESKPRLMQLLNAMSNENFDPLLERTPASSNSRIRKVRFAAATQSPTSTSPPQIDQKTGKVIVNTDTGAKNTTDMPRVPTTDEVSKLVQTQEDKKRSDAAVAQYEAARAKTDQKEDKKVERMKNKAMDEANEEPTGDEKADAAVAVATAAGAVEAAQADADMAKALTANNPERFNITEKGNNNEPELLTQISINNQNVMNAAGNPPQLMNPFKSAEDALFAIQAQLGNTQYLDGSFQKEKDKTVNELTKQFYQELSEQEKKDSQSAASSSSSSQQAPKSESSQSQSAQSSQSSSAPVASPPASSTSSASSGAAPNPLDRR